MESMIRSVTPIAFGGSRKAKENALSDDPKYRKYAAAVDKTLATWDSVHEWADNISFLSRLSKALAPEGKIYPYKFIPSAPVVAARLADCLKPHLAAGVHQKALEVYAIVFRQLGDALNSQIQLWIPGLLPVMMFATIIVRPVLIKTFREFVLPLQPPVLRNITKPLLLGLLPGIDDESNDSFDECLQLVNDFKSRIDDSAHFWQCLFLVVITSSERRLGALIYLNRKLPEFCVSIDRSSTSRRQSLEDSLGSNGLNGDNDVELEGILRDPEFTQQSLKEMLDSEAQLAITPETGLLIRAFCRGLEDNQLLVQRGFLELLVKNLPINSIVLQHMSTKPDVDMLIMAASATVLRRDMSLNRRLWAWLLGPEPTADFSRQDFFNKYAAEPLTKELINKVQNKEPSIYTVALSLLDRWEIGASIVPKILLPVIESSVDAPEDVVRGVKSFFDGVEEFNIFQVCQELLAGGKLDTIKFIFQSFNLQEEEMIQTHLPALLLAELSMPFSASLYELIGLTLALIPDRSFVAQAAVESDEPIDDSMSSQEILQRINEYYGRSSAAVEFPIKRLNSLVIHRLIASAVEHHVYSVLADLLEKVTLKTRPESLIDSLCARSFTTLNANGDANSLDGAQEFAQIKSMILIFPAIVLHMTDYERNRFVRNSIEALWSFIPKVLFQVESVKLLWLLQGVLSDDRVESALSSKFASSATLEHWQSISTHLSNCTGYEDVIRRPFFLCMDYLPVDKMNEWLLQTHNLEVIVHLLNEALHTTDIALFTYYLRVLVRMIGVRKNDVMSYDEDSYNRVLTVMRDRELKSEAFNLCLDYLRITERGDIELLVSLTSTRSSDSLINLISERTANDNASAPMNSIIAAIVEGVKSGKDAEAWVNLIKIIIPLIRGKTLDIVGQLTPYLCSQISAAQPGFQHYVNGLESLLTTSYAYALETMDEMTSQASDPGFLNNVISGVFSVETPQIRNAADSNRRIVKVAIDDSIRVGYEVWVRMDTAIDDSESKIYHCSRIKSRVKKMLINIYSLAPEECLDTLKLIFNYCNDDEDRKRVIKAVHAIDGSKPKNTISHLLKSLDRSSARFVVAYLASFQSDAVEEIWPEVISYLRDQKSSVLIPEAVLICCQLGLKIDGIHFGEQRKIRKELSDSFFKCLNIALAAVDSSSTADDAEAIYEKQVNADIILDVIPALNSALSDNDKVVGALALIISSMITPVTKAKNFPDNIPSYFIKMLTIVTEHSGRAWKASIGDMIMDARILKLSVEQAEAMSVVVQRWCQVDLERARDFFSRIGGANSISMFGTADPGASSNLKITAYILLSIQGKQHNPQLSAALQKLCPKLEELIEKRNTLGSALLSMRAVVLDKIDDDSTSNMSTLWSTLANYLVQVFRSRNEVDIDVMVQVCKLLDTLIVVQPEEFQMHEWLFICDNTKAIFKETDPVGVIDELSNTTVVSKNDMVLEPVSKRAPLLTGRLADSSFLKPFVDKLSIHAYEGMYSLEKPRIDICRQDLLDDIFEG